MTGKLKYYLKNNTNITDKQIDQISGCFRPKTVKKNTLLLSEGETCKELYFVHSGCIRTYYLTKQGHEKTRHIAFDNSIVTSVSSFISQKSSFEFVETLENSELYTISNKDFYQLVSDIPLWENFYRKFLEMAYLHQNKKIENRITLSAKQRYDRLMSEEPMYIQRLSNKILASYLDITQETLSRLKSR
ncbi:Crp/Fnr family transcriptional regulator [Sphingobacterium detergens]|uniref:CRP-like cAMP-binding protein n=1 Tax=Sphingobacterium detergens TaxID=1145106 RepID=A0A420ARN3_SPHD1|nr:Crp/Fnr family transcriptional regulator [Sphingobacterium detergens]RKE47095.1 CRP-like cAMP-binding protein [Sphingobacterium detergens]